MSLAVAARERPDSEPARSALLALSSKRIASFQRGATGGFTNTSSSTAAAAMPPMATDSTAPPARGGAAAEGDGPPRADAVEALGPAAIHRPWLRRLEASRADRKDHDGARADSRQGRGHRLPAPHIATQYARP